MTGYVRKDTTNNIADGNVINAADLDNEFDGIQDAFNASTGHNHDGTSGEGAPITALGPTQDVTISATLLAPKTTNTVDIGSSALKFKDLFLAGNGSIGGTLAVTGVATFTAQPILSSLTASRAVFSDGSKGLVSNAITGTGNVVMSASPTLTGTIDAAALTASGNLTLSGGTANGVAYLNGSKVVTSGSALTFDGSFYLGLTGAMKINSAGYKLRFYDATGATGYGYFYTDGTNLQFDSGNTQPLSFLINGTEGMRLTSTGLGIGTSSPAYKLDVRTGSGNAYANVGRASKSAGQVALQLSGGTSGTDWIIYQDTNSDNLRFFGNSDTRMTLDSSGNLGLGVTPSAWGSSTRAFDVNLSASLSSRTDAFRCLLSNNAYNDNTNWKYKFTSVPALLYQQDGGAHAWFNAPSGTAGNAITFTQAMTLDASGRLGIGTTSPGAQLTVIGSAAKLYVDLSGDNYYDAANHVFRSFAGTERARIDSSGNLGLGVTPSAWGGGLKAIQASTASFMGDGGAAYVSQNWYYNAGNKYIGNGYATSYQTYSGQHIWLTAASGTAGNAITFTQAMTLDASGNLLVGATSNPGILNKSVVVDSGASSLAGFVMQNDATGRTSSDGGALLMNGTEMRLTNYENDAMLFSTNNTERARIDSSGNFLVGTTSAASSTKLDVLSSAGGVAGIGSKVTGGATTQCYAAWNASTTGDAVFHQFYTEASATSRGSISYNRAGGLTAYNTTSDYRAKDIIGSVTDSGSVIDSVPVYMGKMHGATQERPMFIAHETPAYAHTGEKDAVDADGNPIYQQMDASALIPVMWAEIQSLRKRLADAGI